ncbi:DUF397 domain-containing protein [Catenuloplanes nepalensis]|uniref:DUF397 domain-containing protein n=1 Tax=Catenuloplanes nepalensis TaxID=587533 RepID=UPI0027D8FEAF|nr:DUF397 domain-containing protein [Catenuloplanes nepalensis]
MENLIWRKSTRSSPNGGQCVEMAVGSRCIYVRDSKDAGGPVLTVAASSWKIFVRELNSDN